MASVPASAGPADNSVTSNSTVRSPVSMDEPKSNQSTCKPEDGRQEDEGDISLPFLARSFLCEITPVEDTATVERADELFLQVSSCRGKCA